MSKPIELTIRKEGEQWCLYTADGSRKLGCHDTREGAEAQESAVKSNMDRAIGLLQPALVGAARDAHALLASVALSRHPDDTDERFLARQLVELQDIAFVGRFGCQRITDMVSEHGIDPDICAATASWQEDPEKFCALLKKAAMACGLIQKAARDPGSVRFDLADIDVADGTYETLENGDVMKWIPLAEAGEKWLNGGREFDITPDAVGQGIKNFEGRGKAPLPVTFGHLDDSGAPARAWIEDIELRDDQRPWGQLRFLKETWAAIQRGEYKYFSLEFYPSSIDGKGKEIGFEFVGGAILNDPFFPTLRLDQAADRGGACFRLSRFTNTNSDRGVARGAGGDMTTPAPAGGTPAVPAPKIDGDKVTLSREQYQELARVREENQTLRGQIEEAKGRESANEKRIQKLEKESGAARIRSAIRMLQRDHRIVVPLGDFAIDSSEEECFQWLATAPMGITTIDGLEKLARDQEATAHLPRIPGGKEVGGGTDRLPPVDLSSETGRKEAVRRRVVQLKKEYSKDELELMVIRRGHTLEDFAAQELAQEHPEHAKVLLEKK